LFRVSNQSDRWDDQRSSLNNIGNVQLGEDVFLVSEGDPLLPEIQRPEIMTEIYTFDW
jgi:precorrin-6B methylase 1